MSLHMAGGKVVTRVVVKLLHWSSASSSKAAIVRDNPLKIQQVRRRKYNAVQKF